MKLMLGDCLEKLKELADNSVDCVTTSPPYWRLRDYGVEGQLGLEKTPEEYVEKMLRIFKEIHRILKPTGTVWLNLGDTYMSSGGPTRHLGIQDPKYKNGRGNFIEPQCFKHEYLKPKDLVGIPWRIALALQKEGWYLRQDIIWSKPNPLPESVKDRCTKSHEYIFLLSKSAKYYFDHESIKEPQSESSIARQKRGVSNNNKWTEGAGGQSPHSFNQGRENNKERDVVLTRNKRSVWTVSTNGFKGAHFATFPLELIEPCIKAGCPDEGIVLDPFMGSGTTGIVAINNNKDFIGIELNEEYFKIAKNRIEGS